MSEWLTEDEKEETIAADTEVEVDSDSATQEEVQDKGIQAALQGVPQENSPSVEEASAEPTADSEGVDSMEEIPKGKEKQYGL